jgi:hypothetical protein
MLCDSFLIKYLIFQPTSICSFFLHNHICFIACFVNLDVDMISQPKITFIIFLNIIKYAAGNIVAAKQRQQHQRKREKRKSYSCPSSERA